MSTFSIGRRVRYACVEWYIPLDDRDERYCVVSRWGQSIFEIKEAASGDNVTDVIKLQPQDMMSLQLAHNTLRRLNLPICHMCERSYVSIDTEHAIMVSQYPSGTFELERKPMITVCGMSEIGDIQAQYALQNAMQTIECLE